MASRESIPYGDGAGLKTASTDDKPSPAMEKDGTSAATSKAGCGQLFIDIPGSRASLDTPPGLSIYTLEELSATRPSARSPSRERNTVQNLGPPAPSETTGGRWRQMWWRQKGVVLMIMAQFFGASMATTARFMEITTENGEPMSTFQILFVRMSITMVTSMAYMYWAKVPHAPFGPKEVRPLLLARGFGGFFGVFGLYYSLVYLPLAEATVITFLAPMVAAWACSLMIKTPFTRVQQIGGLISICGVVLIAQPFSFTKSDGSAVPASSSTLITAATNTTHSSSPPAPHIVTLGEHAFAVCMALLGVCGAATAYTTISWIGKRAHPIISVNYLAIWCTIVSAGVLAFVPGVTFRLPSGLLEWTLMAFLGFTGFVMQFLLTSALAHSAASGKGLNMVYTQMLFALALDKLVWGTSPGAVSLVGSSLILGSAIWVAMRKDQEKTPTVTPDVADEEEGLMIGHDRGAVNEEESEEMGPPNDAEAPRSDEVELMPVRA